MRDQEPLINCQQVLAAKLRKFLMSELPEKEMRSIAQHLHGCSGCKGRAAWLWVLLEHGRDEKSLDEIQAAIQESIRPHLN